MTLCVYAPHTPKTTTIEKSSYDEKRFQPIVDSLIVTYKKKQFQYNNRTEGSRFFYFIIPITLYPFFCTNEHPDKKYEIIYIGGMKYSAYRYMDNISQEHVQVAVEYHMQGSSFAAMKFYKLHYFLFNLATNQWMEEKAPKEIVLELSNPRDGSYGCKNIYEKKR
jgi:hypothetical protein